MFQIGSNRNILIFFTILKLNNMKNEKHEIRETQFLLIAKSFQSVFFDVLLTLNKYGGGLQQHELLLKIHAAISAASIFNGIDTASFQKVSSMKHLITLHYVSNSGKYYTFEFDYSKSGISPVITFEIPNDSSIKERLLNIINPKF